MTAWILLSLMALTVAESPSFIRIAALARAYSVMISPHVLQHIHMHLVATLQEPMRVEFFMVDNPLMSFVIRLFSEPKEALQHRDGMLDLPTAPGFGLKLDPELAARCKVADSSMFS